METLSLQKAIAFPLFEINPQRPIVIPRATVNTRVTLTVQQQVYWLTRNLLGSDGGQDKHIACQILFASGQARSQHHNASMFDPNMILGNVFLSAFSQDYRYL